MLYSNGPKGTKRTASEAKKGRDWPAIRKRSISQGGKKVGLPERRMGGDEQSTEKKSRLCTEPLKDSI